MCRVVCRIYHTVVLDDPFDDPPGLDSHVPDQSPQLTRDQLDVSHDSHPFTRHSCMSVVYHAQYCFMHLVV